MANVLIPLIIILAIVALVQITRVSELLGELKRLTLTMLQKKTITLKDFYLLLLEELF